MDKKKITLSLIFSTLTLLVLSLCLFKLLYLDSVERKVASSEVSELLDQFKMVDKKELKKKVDNGQFFLLYLGNEECGGCQEATPLIYKEVKKYTKTDLYYMDTLLNENKEVLTTYGINFVPTILVFNNKKIIYRFNGFSSEDVDKLSEVMSGDIH